MGLYAGIIVIVKLIPSGKKAAPAITASVPDSGEIPSVDAPNFGDWLAAPGNIEKLLGSA